MSAEIDTKTLPNEDPKFDLQDQIDRLVTILNNIHCDLSKCEMCGWIVIDLESCWDKCPGCHATLCFECDHKHDSNTSDDEDDPKFDLQDQIDRLVTFLKNVHCDLSKCEMCGWIDIDLESCWDNCPGCHATLCFECCHDHGDK